MIYGTGLRKYEHFIKVHFCTIQKGKAAVQNSLACGLKAIINRFKCQVYLMAARVLLA